MGTLNPETLYKKVYSDSSFKKNGVIINEVTTKDFREFLQRTKPNFDTVDGSTDRELLESLSVLVNNNADIGKEICSDIQENFCSSICNEIHTAPLLKSKAIIVGTIVSFAAIIIYKMRKNSITDKNSNTNITSCHNELSTNDNNSDNDQETEVISVGSAPRIVTIKKGWWFW